MKKIFSILVCLQVLSFQPAQAEVLVQREATQEVQAQNWFTDLLGIGAGGTAGAVACRAGFHTSPLGTGLCFIGGAVVGLGISRYFTSEDEEQFKKCGDTVLRTDRYGHYHEFRGDTHTFRCRADRRTVRQGSRALQCRMITVETFKRRQSIDVAENCQCRTGRTQWRHVKPELCQDDSQFEPQPQPVPPAPVQPPPPASGGIQVMQIDTSIFADPSAPWQTRIDAVKGIRQQAIASSSHISENDMDAIKAGFNRQVDHDYIEGMLRFFVQAP